jgi:purine-binding chemotaxis protein CheW
MMKATGVPAQSEPNSGSDSTRPAALSRYCLFTLGEESLAIELGQVREVFQLESITPVPGMPPLLVGVANLRGTVVPLADLRPSLGVPNVSVPRYAVVVRQGARQIGILIEELPEIRTIQPEDVLDASLGEETRSRAFLSGLLKMEGRTSGLVEVSGLLAMVEGTNDEQAA